jgi:hypothetical protein
MSPELAGLDQRMRAVLCPLNAEQTQREPPGRPGAWSVLQIVEHLRLTYRSTCASFEVRLGKGTPTLAQPTLVQRVGQFALLRLGYFPTGRRAPEPVCPAAGLEPQSGLELADGFREDLTRMDESIARAQGLFGEQRAISHQVLGPLSACEWRGFHRIHGLHHLKQIEAIRAQRDRVQVEPG